MTQITINFVHSTERHGTQSHLDDNRERFAGQLRLLYDKFIHGERLTAIDASGFGVMRLASRVNELRKNGVPIKSEWVKIGQTKHKLYYYERH